MTNFICPEARKLIHYSSSLKWNFGDGSDNSRLLEGKIHIRSCTNYSMVYNNK